MNEMNNGSPKGHDDSVKSKTDETSRAPYEAPEVRRFGTVEDLTTAVTGTGGDAGTASMAGG